MGYIFLIEVSGSPRKGIHMKEGIGRHAGNGEVFLSRTIHGEGDIVYHPGRMTFPAYPIQRSFDYSFTDQTYTWGKGLKGRDKAKVFILAHRKVQMGCPTSPMANYENGGGMNACVPNDSAVSDRFIKSEGANKKSGEGNK